MASNPKITIRVYSARGSSKMQYTTTGRYVSFTTAGYQRTLPLLPLQPTASLTVFWQSVLNTILADLTANPNPP